MKLTKGCRSDLIDLLIKDKIKYYASEGASESEGLKEHISCDLHNGITGYSKFTDEELLSELVFLRWGFDLKWGE